MEEVERRGHRDGGSGKARVGSQGGSRNARAASMEEVEGEAAAHLE